MPLPEGVVFDAYHQKSVPEMVRVGMDELMPFLVNGGEDHEHRARITAEHLANTVQVGRVHVARIPSEQVRGIAAGVVGMVTFYPVHLVHKRFGYVHDLVVHGRFQGTPIAHELMNRLESAAWEDGFPQIELTSNPKRTKALQFYARRGYVPRDTNVLTLIEPTYSI